MDSLVYLLDLYNIDQILGIVKPEDYLDCIVTAATPEEYLFDLPF